MNYIMTFFFLVLIVCYYKILGNLTTELFDLKYYQKKEGLFQLITGFISFYFIMFLVGIICQLLKTSWTTYYYCSILMNFFIILLFIYKNRLHFSNYVNKIKIFKWKSLLEKSKEVIKDNWVIILFALLFSLFSISNVKAMFTLNNDDYFYLGKIINNIETPCLINENYYNGTLLTNMNIDYVRILNTYELTYAFLSQVFHIHPSFFCKVVMVFHNYMLFGMVYKQLAMSFCEKNICQFVILPFFIFLISAGMLSQNNLFSIRSFDLWQFQTAMWYGGSIVRTMSIPLILIYSIHLIEYKLRLKNFIFIGIVCLNLLSFSTVSIPIIVIMAIILVGIKIGYYLLISIKENNKKKILLFSLIFLMGIFIILATKKLDNTILLSGTDFNNFKNTLLPYKERYVMNDMIYKLFFVVVILGFISLYKNKGKYIVLTLVFLHILVVSGKFLEFNCLLSFKYFFVIARFYSSIQYLLIFIIGTLIILYMNIILKKHVIHIVSLCVVLMINIYIYLDYDKIISYDYPESGINQNGYDFSQIIKYDNMVVPIFNEVSEYFSTLKYDNYTLISQYVIDCNDHITFYPGFSMNSNRVQIVYMTDEESQSHYDNINNYFNKNIEINQVKESLSYFKNSYFLVFLNEQKNELMEYGMKEMYNGDGFTILYQQ